MSSSRISQNKVVHITYQIRDQAGNLLERTDLPVSYVHGAKSELLEKIEASIEGHAIGDTVTVTLAPEEGFGPHRPDLTYEEDLENVPPEYRRVGAEVTFANDKGDTITMVVSRIDSGKLTLDGNHPFAGQAVTFQVTVSDIREATPAEIQSGMPAERLQELF